MAKIAAGLRPFADGSVVRTSLVAGGGKAAGSQRAYSLGSCAMGQTGDGSCYSKMSPIRRGHNNTEHTYSREKDSQEMNALIIYNL